MTKKQNVPLPARGRRHVFMTCLSSSTSYFSLSLSLCLAMFSSLPAMDVDCISTSSSASSSTSLKICIIGFGRFGQFLSKRFITQGHSVMATSRSDYSEICSQLGITFFTSLEPILEAGNDVILICTSILSFSQILKSIPFHLLNNKKTLFADVLSVKEHPRDLLLQLVPEESDVLCTHPMFGPDGGRGSWEGLTFMFDKVRIRDEQTCSSFLAIFQNEGCTMVELSCEEHDKRAAHSQFLTHTIGRTLLEMDIKTTSMDTKGFESLLHLKDTTVQDSFDLYCGLFVHNRFAKEELKNLELALETVKQKLLAHQIE